MFNKVHILFVSICMFVTPVFAAVVPTSVSQNKNNLFPDRKITSEGTKLVAKQKKLLNKKYYDVNTFEEVYTREPRNIGNKILDLAIMNWVDPDPAITDVMIQWCEKALKKDTWGNNLDLEMSHLLFALSVVYDWNKETLPSALKMKLREFIYSHAKFQQAFASTKVSWGISYWQNHAWINHSSILAASLALTDDYPEAKNWFDFENNKFKKIAMVQPVYGSNHEGLNYSLYGNIWLVRSFTLLKSKGFDYFAQSDYLKNYYKFFKAYSVNEKMDTFFDVGDSPSFLWYNPTEVFFKLNKEYNITAYKELYDFYSGFKVPIAGLMSAVYGLENIEPRDSLPLNDHDFFSDMGVYIEHTIKDGETQNAFYFKSGIAGGRWDHDAYRKNHDNTRLNISHSHPDQNHFIIRTPAGALIADTGNSKHKKSTAGHNTLIVNGVGQLGEGKKWFNEKVVNDINFSSQAGLIETQVFFSDAISIVSANAAEFYPEKAGLNKFFRTVVWIKSLGFLVFDSINLKEPSDTSMFFHSDFVFRKHDTNAYYAEDSDGIIGDLTVLYPAAPSIEIQRHTEAIKPEKEPKGDFVKIDQKIGGDGYLITSVLLDKNPVQQTLSETENQFQITFLKGTKKYVAIFKKSSGANITYEKFTTDANAIIFLLNDKKAVIYGGTSLMNEDKSLWKAASPSNAILKL